MASPCDSESYMPLAKRRRRSNSFEDAPDLVKGDILVDSNRPRKPRRNFDRHMVFNVLPGPKVNASLPPRVDSMAAEPVVTLDAAQERCSDWWLDTGDLVLGVENLMLKVHKRVLAEHSIIFGDMFDISQPELSNDGAENLPFVQLQDTAADWIETLKWLYTGTPSYDIFSIETIPFSTIKSHLTISNKYEMTSLRALAQRSLECLYPTSLDLLFSGSPSWQSKSLLHAAEAIIIARLCDIPSVLPAAFYRLSTAKWRYDEDGGRAHASLSPLDVRRLIVGREALLDATIRLATTLSVPFGLVPPNVQALIREDRNLGPNSPPIMQSFCSHICANLVLSEWSSAFFSPGSAYKNISLLKTLIDLAETRPHELCLDCLAVRSDWLLKQTRLVMLSIPGWFGL